MSLCKKGFNSGKTKDFPGPWLSRKCPSWVPSTRLSWSSPAQPCFYFGLPRGPAGTASLAGCKANCPASNRNLPAVPHQPPPIRGNFCRPQQGQRNSALYLVGEHKGEWERRDLCPRGRVSWTSHIVGTKSLCVTGVRKLRSFQDFIFL